MPSGTLLKLPTTTAVLSALELGKALLTPVDITVEHFSALGVMRGAVCVVVEGPNVGVHKVQCSVLGANLRPDHARAVAATTSSSAAESFPSDQPTPRAKRHANPSQPPTTAREPGLMRSQVEVFNRVSGDV